MNCIVGGIKMRMILFFVAVSWCISSGSALAFCYQPSAPMSFSKPSKPTEPRTPFCVNQFSGTHSCSAWEIDQYNSEVDNYNRRLASYQRDVEDYIDDLQQYVDEAVAFAQCEIRSL